MVGPEDADDSDVEMVPEDQELNYGERQLHGIGSDAFAASLHGTDAVFNHHHGINSLQVN